MENAGLKYELGKAQLDLAREIRSTGLSKMNSPNKKGIFNYEEEEIPLRLPSNQIIDMKSLDLLIEDKIIDLDEIEEEDFQHSSLLRGTIDEKDLVMF